jgi:hypothetical protein
MQKCNTVEHLGMLWELNNHSVHKISMVSMGIKHPVPPQLFKFLVQKEYKNVFNKSKKV